MAAAFEIRCEDEFLFLMRAFQAGASAPISQEELLYRWLTKAVAFEGQKPEPQAAILVRKFVKITRK